MPEIDVGAALADLRRLVEVGFTQVNGQIELLLQRFEHMDARHAELARRVKALEEDANRKVSKEEFAERQRRQLTIISLMLTGAGVVIAALSLIISTNT